MKKSLLALAVLGAFAGGAMAQSSVTIYGIVDMGVVKANDGTVASPNVPNTDAWYVQQSSSSRLGFRGSEDLGGGLSAQFQIEHRFTPDDGEQVGVMWHGRSYVQLSGGFGAVYMGREYAPVFWPAVKSDPFGYDGVGARAGASYAGYGTPNNGGARMANTIGYKTPKFGGLTANLAVGLSEDSGQGRANGFNIEYGAGPLYAALGYESVSDGALDDNSLVNVAVNYDLGYVRPMFYYGRAEVGAAENDVVSLGATAPLGGGRLKAVIFRLDRDGVAELDKFGLGYDYPLSKRTRLYADVSSARQDGFETTSAFDFGIRHTF